MPTVNIAAVISASSSFAGAPYYQSAPIGAAIKLHLENQAGIERVYPVRLPQNPVYPCVTFQVITTPRGHTMENAVSPNPLVQIDCWAKTYLAVQTLARTVEMALDGYVGRMGGILPVTGCLQRENGDQYEVDVDDYRVSLDFSIWHN